MVETATVHITFLLAQLSIVDKEANPATETTLSQL